MNSRRIQSRIAIDATLQTIWYLLTDFERLADFIPGLAVSQLLEKRENFARIFQINSERRQQIEPPVGQEFQTTLTYTVDVEPKLWLPVRLVEGRLRGEIKMNLLSIREEAHKTVLGTLPTC